MSSQRMLGTWVALVAVIAMVALSAATCPGTGEYTVKGKVTSKASNTAVDGIAVTCQVAGGVAGTATSGTASVEDGGSAEAGAEDAGVVEPGSYLCRAPALAGQASPASIEVRFVDADGAQNGGEFANLTQSVEVELNGEATLDAQLEAK